eukprot:PhM_4_TR10696/c0_g1_i1/m.69248
MQSEDYATVVATRREAMLQHMRSRRQEAVQHLTNTNEHHAETMRRFHANRREEARMAQIVKTRAQERLERNRVKTRERTLAEIEHFESAINSAASVPRGGEEGDAVDGEASESAQAEGMQNEISIDEAVLERQPASFEEYVKRMHNRRNEDTAARTRKAERRARTVLQQQHVYRTYDGVRRRNLVEAKREQPASLEAEFLLSLAQQAKWYDVVKHNSQYRNTQLKNVASARDVANESNLNDIHSRAMDEFKHRTDVERTKWEALGAEMRKQEREHNTEVCTHILDGVLDLAMLEVEYMERDFMCEKEFPQDKRVEAARWFAVQGTAPTLEELETKNEMMPDEFTDYTKLTGRWEPEDTGSLNILSGSRVSHILHTLEEIANPPPVAPEPELRASSLYIVCIGRKYTGKTLACRRIAKELNLFHANNVQILSEVMATDWDAVLDSTTSDSLKSVYLQEMELAMYIKSKLCRGMSIDEETQIRLLILKMREFELLAVENPDDAPRGFICDGVPSTAGGFEYLRRHIRKDDLVEGEHREVPFFHSIVPQRPALSGAEVIDEPPPPEAEKPEGGKKDTKAPAKKSKGKDEPEEPLPPIELPEVGDEPRLEEEEASIVEAARYFSRYETGLHLVLDFECPSEEVFARYAGIRIDRETKEMYHLTFFPPPAERLPYLDEPNRTEADNADLHNKIRSMEVEQGKYRNWFSMRQNILRVVDATQPVETVVQGAVDIAGEAKSEAQNEFETEMKAREIKCRHADAIKAHKEVMVQREETRKRLAAIYKERGVDLPPELHDPPPVLRTLAGAEAAIPARVTTALLGAFKQDLAMYEDGVKRGLQMMSSLQHRLSRHWILLVQAFAMFISRQRPTSSLLTAFQDEFNSFDEEWRLDDVAKDELHLRTDVLHEAMCKEVTQRNDDGKAQIDGYAKAPVNDTWVEAVRGSTVELMQCEVNRFMATVRLIVQYYSEVLGREIKMEPFQVSAAIVGAARNSLDFNLLDHIQFNDPSAAPPPEPTKDAKGKKDTKPAAKAPPKRAQSIVGEDPEARADSIGAAFNAAQNYLTRILGLEDAAVQVEPPTTKPSKAAAQEKTEDVKRSPVIDAAVKKAIAEECDLLKDRLFAIKAHGQSAVSWGNGVQSQSLQTMKLALAAEHNKELRLVSDALAFVRTAIEEERPLHYPIVINDTRALEDTDNVLVPIPAAPPAMDINIVVQHYLLPWLTLEQCNFMIREWKAQSSEGVLGKDQYLNVMNSVRSLALCGTDYVADVSTFWSCVHTNHVQKVFDLHMCKSGKSNWRAMLLHLLLWSESEVARSHMTEAEHAFGNKVNPFYVPSPQMSELVNLRQEIFQLCTDRVVMPTALDGEDLAGVHSYEEEEVYDEDDYDEEDEERARSRPVVTRVPECQYLTFEAFSQLNLWLERRLTDVLSRHIRQIIWDLFAIDPPSEEIEASVRQQFPATPQGPFKVMHWPSFLRYFCIDEQHVRGVQKAFAVLSQPTDDNSTLTLADIRALFQLENVTGVAPDATQCAAEAHTDAHLKLLFREVGTTVGEIGIKEVSFDETCRVHRGRVLWNHAVMYSRSALDFAQTVDDDARLRKEKEEREKAEAEALAAAEAEAEAEAKAKAEAGDEHAPEGDTTESTK